MDDGSQAVGDIHDFALRRASQHLLIRRCYPKVELKHYTASPITTVPSGAHVFTVNAGATRDHAAEVIAIDPTSMTVVYHGLAPS